VPLRLQELLVSPFNANHSQWPRMLHEHIGCKGVIGGLQTDLSMTMALCLTGSDWNTLPSLPNKGNFAPSAGLSTRF